MNEWNGAEPTVWSDDALLDAIGRGAVGRDSTGVERVLIGWRSEAHRRPMRELVSTAAAGPTLFNSRAEFVRLLWEASITRTGGFYLYYYNAEDSSGLPERIFNDKGEAVLTLIAGYVFTWLLLPAVRIEYSRRGQVA